MNATPFTPWLGLAGGTLIGLAAALLLWTDGRVAGVSGILGRALVPQRGDFAWRAAFLLGLPLGAVAAIRATGDVHGFALTHHVPTLLAGGVLVGLGTALGSGCTSGHGVCGMARGSPRSLVATATFMAVALATTYLLRHVFGVA